MSRASAAPDLANSAVFASPYESWKRFEPEDSLTAKPGRFVCPDLTRSARHAAGNRTKIYRTMNISEDSSALRMFVGTFLPLDLEKFHERDTQLCSSKAVALRLERFE